jgi:hypothetical protein
VQLTEEEQESELAMLNPFERKNIPTKRMILPTATTRTNKDSYLSNVMSEQADGEEIEVLEESNRGFVCTNSTKQLILPYWSFVFGDIHLRDYVCVQINLPSGLCDEVHGLHDRVEATVSSCKNKLIVMCEWPETLTRSVCMEDALAGLWNENTNTGRGYSGSTVSNMVLAFKKEIHKIRVQNKLGKNSLLGGTCHIDLPFPVESDMVFCEPSWDKTIGSVNLYVVLKRICKNNDLYQDKRMAVRITNALGHDKKPEYNPFHSTNNKNYYDDNFDSNVNNPGQYKRSRYE